VGIIQAMKRLVVIGAGISGLAAAHTAVQKVNSDAGQIPGGLEVIVLERDSRAGGKVRTIREDGSNSSRHPGLPPGDFWSGAGSWRRSRPLRSAS